MGAALCDVKRVTSKYKQYGRNMTGTKRKSELEADSSLTPVNDQKSECSVVNPFFLTRKTCVLTCFLLGNASSKQEKQIEY